MLEVNTLPGWLGPKRLNAEIWMTPRHMENTCLAFPPMQGSSLWNPHEQGDKQVPEASRSQLKQPDAPARGTLAVLLLKTLNSGKQGVQGSGGDDAGRPPPRCHFVLPLWTLGMEGLIRVSPEQAIPVTSSIKFILNVQVPLPSWM